jgi:hypothetical protein
MFEFLIGKTQTDRCQISERELRQQLKELEREATTFNELLGLLKAALALNGQSETQWQLQLEQLDLQSKNEAIEQHRAIAKSQELIIEGLRREHLHTHILNLLYRQLLESKRNFLYHWRLLLKRHLHTMPCDRQQLLNALIDNSLQSLLSVGIEQLQDKYFKELEEIARQMPPFGSEQKTDSSNNSHS